MKTVLKAIWATFAAIAPIVVKNYAGPHWTAYVTVVYGSLLFFVNLYVVAPDRRFLAVRVPAVKGYLKTALAGVPGNSIRANVYVKKWRWGWPTLVPVISYNSNPLHADYGKKWWWKRGLCWHVFRSGKFGYCRKGHHNPKMFGMKRADCDSTSHVEAVLCVPLRKLAASPETGVSGKVCAVLAYDAITVESADFLKAQHDSLAENKNRELLDLVEAISLYF